MPGTDAYEDMLYKRYYDPVQDFCLADNETPWGARRRIGTERQRSAWERGRDIPTIADSFKDKGEGQ